MIEPGVGAIESGSLHCFIPFHPHCCRVVGVGLSSCLCWVLLLVQGCQDSLDAERRWNQGTGHY